jgi:hypothetical protein
MATSRCCTTWTWPWTPARPSPWSGPTGAGKSTLARLLARLYDVDEGACASTGWTCGRSPADLRRLVTLVPQDMFLFADTIRENIRYGDPRRPTPRSRPPPAAPRRTTLSPACPGLRQPGGRAGRHAVGRAAATGRLCPRPAGRSQDPDPGRGDGQRGRLHRGADPAGHGRDPAGPHHADHRPPLFDAAQGRPHRGGRGRAQIVGQGIARGIR